MTERQGRIVCWVVMFVALSMTAALIVVAAHLP